MTSATIVKVLSPDLTSLIKSYSKETLQQALSSLTLRYKNENVQEKPPRSVEEAIAYAIVRAPSTIGVLERVLKELPQEKEIQSVLDVGAGTGMQLQVYEKYFKHSEVTLVENNPYMREVQKLLFQQAPRVVLENSSFELFSPEKKDVTVLSYMLNEIESQALQPHLQKYWEATQKYLIIIEPGTQKSFALLKEIRRYFIDTLFKSTKGHILAPCGHEEKCPLEGHDWCHFKLKINRTPLHKNLKLAKLPFELEPYSYLIIAKESPVNAPSLERVIKSPMKRKGHIILDTCSKEGLKRKTIEKSQKDCYRLAKKMAWGDTFPQKKTQETDLS